MKYRKKPVVIEAWQWVGNLKEMPIPPAPSSVLKRRRGGWKIATPDGWVNISPYDYIICGVSNDWYPCKPDIFKQTYEEVK